MHGSEIIHLRYKNNTPENTKNPINKMVSEMASSKHRLLPLKFKLIILTIKSHTS